MLAFTPEVLDITRWFHATHHVVVTPIGGVWQRFALPEAGGAGDQDARLMAALDYRLAVMNRLAFRPKKTDTDTELAEFADRHQ